MSEEEQHKSNLETLRDLDADSQSLEHLEALLDRFNIFEAVGITWQEKHHSKFLAFLLDPNESHGMGDAFVKRLLQRAVTGSPNISASVTPSLWDLSETTVRREWQWIDIFLLDGKNRLAVIIENKIWSGEHSDQLNRYYAAVKKEYPEHEILALYLTPGGGEPSHPEYLPANYRMVCEILDELAESRAAITEPDARTLVKHYTEMLRRHIVGDHEIERLSREIYARHSRAIDLIVRHQNKSQQEIRDQIWHLCENLIDEHKNFDLLHSGKEKIGFKVRYWKVPYETFYFQFWNFLPKSLELKLFIGPASKEPESKETRQRLFQIVRVNTETFVPQGEFGATWNVAHNLKFLEEPFYTRATDSEREAEIRKNWDDFLENDLPRIDTALKNESWIWDSEESETPSRRSDKFTRGEGDIQILNGPDDEPEEDEE